MKHIEKTIVIWQLSNCILFKGRSGRAGVALGRYSTLAMSTPPPNVSVLEFDWSNQLKPITKLSKEVNY